MQITFYTLIINVTRNAMARNTSMLRPYHVQIATYKTVNSVPIVLIHRVLFVVTATKIMKIREVYVHTNVQLTNTMIKERASALIVKSKNALHVSMIPNLISPTV
jgi:hypothetical protein